jgi:RNA polymerase sigma factor (sigma-70 family)
MTEFGDHDLLQRWAGGDLHAGRQLFERHFAAVRRFFVGKADARINYLVQQTFLVLLEARPRYRAESSFRAFVLAIARSQLYEHWRRTSRFTTLDFSIHSLRDLGTSPSSEVARRESRRALTMALQTMPLDMQLAVELTHFEGLGAAEVATVLDLSIKTVYSQLHRARELLREQLEVDGDVPAMLACEVDAMPQQGLPANDPG